jgi:hypothetical protein
MTFLFMLSLYPFLYFLPFKVGTSSLELPRFMLLSLEDENKGYVKSVHRITINSKFKSCGCSIIEPWRAVDPHNRVLGTQIGAIEGL